MCVNVCTNVYEQTKSKIALTITSFLFDISNLKCDIFASAKKKKNADFRTWTKHSLCKFAYQINFQEAFV